MHGYQLSKRLTDTLGGFWRVSYGSLYPSLKRLERQGAVEQVFDELEVGRRKNVYRITEQGETVFRELLDEAGADATGEDNRFRVRLAFFKYLAPDARIRLLERRRTFLEQRLDTITGSLTMKHDTYTLSLMQHGRETTEQDIAWLNGLIAAERRATETTATGAPKRREPRAIRRKERTT